MFLEKNIRPLYDPERVEYMHNSPNKGDQSDTKIPNEPHVNFRLNLYWNEEIDYMWKAHEKLIDWIFRKYAGTDHGSAQPLSCNRFEDLFKDMDLLNDHFAARDIAVSYNLAIMTYVNEL